MARGCWCTLLFHLPGERARHQEANRRAREILGMVESMEEVAAVELNYEEICTLLESGTVAHGSALYEKLRAARDAFLREPKVYGNGLRGYLKIKAKEAK